MGNARQSDDPKPKRKMSPAQLANLKGGSRKGIPNRVTRLAKEAIAEAAEGLGGTDRIIEWAQESPENEKAFWTQLYPKLIPVQVANADDEPFKVDARLDVSKLSSTALKEIASLAPDN